MKLTLQELHRRAGLYATTIVFAFGLSASALAQSSGIRLVRDTEIENTIRVFAAPVFAAAGVNPSSVSINLVQSTELNAFVAGGQRIFVHTGLLLRTTDALQVIGVLAHEIGHIAGGHLARFRDGVDAAQTSSIVGLLLGIPAAIVTGRSDVAVAASTLGQQVGQRQFLKFTRGMEQSADQAAVGFLDDAGFSSRGLLAFLNVLDEQRKLYSAGTNAYTGTHPLSQDRINFVARHVETSPYSDAPLNPTYTRLHERMRAKIAGYTLPPGEVDKLYPADDNSIPALYAHAMSLMRQSKIDDALRTIGLLIQREPENPFFYELKGDLLRNGGQIEDSLVPYRRAIEILPWAALIRLSLGRSLVDLNSAEYEDEAEGNLKEALRYEPWLTSGWRLLATIYSRRNDTGNLALAQAEEAIRSRRAKIANNYAEKAMNILAEGSPGWLRAQDIQVQANKGKFEEDAG